MSYPAPWKGETLLVCSKCRKKLKKRQVEEFGRIRKWFKQRAKHDGRKLAHVLETSCMGICPKRGVTLLRPADAFRGETRFRILRSEGELEALYSDLLLAGSRTASRA